MSSSSTFFRPTSSVYRSLVTRKAWQRVPCRRVALSAHPSPTRTFSTTHLRWALSQQQHIPTQHSILLTFPTEKDIEEAELDAEPIPPEEAKIELTDRAAEVRKTVPLFIIPMCLKLFL